MDCLEVRIGQLRRLDPGGNRPHWRHQKILVLANLYYKLRYFLHLGCGKEQKNFADIV
jgi:hypothetical protein